ncbi:MAG: Stk1 family PASTA domain-containing Ser/Thr kinase [Culicoidibacterales bacterium]
MEIKEGMKIDGRYNVQELIGEGGMANVYLAEDIILGRPVAVKVLHNQLAKQERFVERFRREAEAVSSLIHPHIVEIYDVGEQDGMYFIVMELLEGKTIKEYVRLKHFLSVSETISIMKQASQAVELAHRNGIIHRDLKPQNIFIKDDGTIKIMDFGIAYQQEATPLTQTNAVMGSVHYLSPEQAKGENATVQTDIYSLGIVMFEMLTGNVPFSGDSAVNIVLQHLREPIPYVSDSNMHIPQSVENVVIRATAKNPDDRYQTLELMRKDLDTCLNVERMNEPRVYFEALEQTAEIAPKLEVEEIEAPEKPPFKLNKKKAAILSAAILAVLVLIFSVITMLGANNVMMPNIVNKTEAEAISLLHSAGLQPGTISKEASESVELGKVIKAELPEKTKAKRDERINFTVSRGKLVKMPKVVGKKQAEAETQLSTAKIKFKVEKAAPANGEEDGIVIKQSLSENADVYIATDEIIITVAETSPIELTDLTGYYLGAAQDYANTHKLILEVADEYSETVEINRVIRMPNYWPGKTVKPGDTIQVVISKGPKPVSKPNPPETSSNNNTSTIPQEEITRSPGGN